MNCKRAQVDTPTEPTTAVVDLIVDGSHISYSPYYYYYCTHLLDRIFDGLTVCLSCSCSLSFTLYLHSRVIIYYI